jgi:hemoglobin
MGYAEWGSRLALHNSQPDADDVAEEAPVPRWGWEWRLRTRARRS